MATRTIRDQAASTLSITTDGQPGTPPTAEFRLFLETDSGQRVPPESYPIDLAAAITAAAAATGRTEAVIRDCLRAVYVAARAQARTAGGLS